MSLFTDQTGSNIVLTGKPVRIISLVPSQTELLYYLGLDEYIVGITTFCIHPAHWFRHKTRIGGTKSIHINRVNALQPDLIIANKEENTKEQIEELLVSYPVWTSDISNLHDALEMITTIGELTGTAVKAQILIDGIKIQFAQLPEHSPARAAYLIWQNPYMTIGGDTFINDMLTRCGLKNIFDDRHRYPIITVEEIRNRDCRLLLLASEPFPFGEKHIEALQQQLPSTKIMLANGEMFSWYGSRLLLAPAYFSALRSRIN